jgi:hypothetical protein
VKNSTALVVLATILTVVSLFIEGPRGAAFMTGAFFCLLAGAICHAIEIK